MRFPFPRSLCAQLTCLALGIALPMAGLVAYMHVGERNNRIAMAGETARNLAGSVAVGLAQLIETERAMLAALAARPAQRVERPPVCDPLIAEARTLNPYRANVNVITSTGEVVCSGLPMPSGAPVTVIDKEFAQRLLKTGTFTLGEPFVGPIAGRRIVPLALPRYDAAEYLIGWVGAPLDAKRIEELLVRTNAGRRDIISVISAQGTIISRSSDAEKFAGRSVIDLPFGPALLDGSLTTWRSSSLDGKARIWGAASVPIAGWKVVAGIDEGELLAPANAALQRDVFLFGLIVLLAAGLAALMGRVIAAPIRQLAHTANRISQGERGLRTSAGGSAEVAEIAAEFNHMLDALERSESERGRLAQIVEQTTDIVGIAAADGTMIYLNSAGRDLIGVSPEDSLECVNSSRAYAPDSWRVISKVARPHALAFGTWSGETSMRHPDGREFPVLQVVMALKGKRGEAPLFATIARSISERKQAEALLTEQKRILEMIARGAPLQDTLEALARVVESRAPDMLVSILLLDADGVHVRHGTAPSLPAAFVRAIDGEPIGAAAGSCGTAMYRRAAVIVEDIAASPLWDSYRPLAEAHGLRACWSTPIFDRQARVLGTFALYFRTPMRPQPEHYRQIDMFSGLAGIAMERAREDATLRKSEASLAAAQARAGIGSWELDLSTLTGTWSAEMFRLFGRDPHAGVPPLPEFIEAVHPEDRAQLEEAHARAVASGESAVVEYRTHPGRGPVRHLSASLHPETATGAGTGSEAKPTVTRISGTVLDVTERKMAERALRDSGERLERLSRRLIEVQE